MLRTLSGAVNLADPINKSASLNKGLEAWFLALSPCLTGSRFLDLCGRHHLTLTGGPTWHSPGRPHYWKSLRCDAAGEGAEVAANPSVELALPITVSCWLKTLGTVEDGAGIFGVVHNTADTDPWSSYYLGSGGGAPANAAVAFFNSAGSFGSLDSTFSLTSINWTHLAATFSAADVRLYVNGVLNVARGSGISNPTYGATAAVFVGNYGGVSRNANSLIDNAKIWSRDLGDQGVMRDYQAGLNGNKAELNWLSRWPVSPVTAAPGGDLLLRLMGEGLYTGSAA